MKIFSLCLALLICFYGRSQYSGNILNKGNLYGFYTPAEDQKYIVIIHPGSGPTDHNGNQAGMNNNSLKYLAEALNEKGIATLSIDKRGIGKSQAAGLSEADLRFEVYVDDLKTWIDLAKDSLKYEQIYLAGHSEGSLIAILAAQNNIKVDGLISISGAGIPARDILKKQLLTLPENIKEDAYNKLDSIQNGQKLENVSPIFTALFRPSVQDYLISWFQYDPATEIAKIKQKTLIINGTSDIQVGSEQAKILHDAKSDSKLVLVEDMNHVLKKCKNCSFDDQLKIYNDSEEKIMKEVPKEMIAFILGK